MSKQKLGTCDKSPQPHELGLGSDHNLCPNWKPIKTGGFWSNLGNAIGEALFGGDRQ